MGKRKAVLVMNYGKARGMKFNDAVRLCMAETKKTGMECLFTYNAKTRKLTSAIIRGVEKDVVPMPFDVFGARQGIEHPDAVFHTHPRTLFSCAFSHVDINTDIVESNRKEMTLGCTNKDVMLTFNMNEAEGESFNVLVKDLIGKHQWLHAYQHQQRDEFLSFTRSLKRRRPDLASAIDEINKEFVKKNVHGFKHNMALLYNNDKQFRNEIVSFVNKNATSSKVKK